MRRAAPPPDLPRPLRDAPPSNGPVERRVAAHEALAREAVRRLDQALAAERLGAAPLSATACMTQAQLAAVAPEAAHLTMEQERAADAVPPQAGLSDSSSLTAAANR